MSTMPPGSVERPLRVAVIGSGPAGFYAARHLLDAKELRAEVDVFDRLPTPYGLVRGGVAPDHQKIKSVVKVYEKTAAMQGFRFFGHVALGRDVSLAELQARYDQIVLAVGNESDRRLGIPGEGMVRCTPASVFVGWYNGHPDYAHFRFDLSVKRVAVVGNGNVAIDVARILATDPEILARTDIAPHALEALRASRVEEVIVLGRRGPVQAAFTPSELKEIAELPGTDALVDPLDLALDPHEEEALALASDRARRNLELLRACAARERSASRALRLRFLVSPVEVLADEDGGVGALNLARNRLVQGEDGSLSPKPSGEHETLPVGMVLTAVGYRGRAIEGVPFDERRGLIPNQDGRVLRSAGGPVVPNLYVVGWARSGPQGLIGSHRAASGEVVQAMLADLAAGSVPPSAARRPAEIEAWLTERAVPYVSFADWQVLDATEVARGQRREAPREKLTDVAEMLALVGKGPAER